MVKVANPPACTELVGCQEFHLPLIECALLLVHHITTPQVGLTLCMQFAASEQGVWGWGY
jgi:hypothetical protein